jgi:hypothetical protein
MVKDSAVGGPGGVTVADTDVVVAMDDEKEAFVA